MASSILTEELGPRGRRRVAIATAASLVLLAVFAWFAIRQLADQGQLDWELWQPFIEARSWTFLLEGLVGTIQAAATAMVFVVAFGFLVALGRLSRTAPVRWLSGTYVEVFRSIPLLLLIFAVFFGVQNFVDLGIFWSLVVALTLYNSAVLAEIFRAGILSLEHGQTEAAQAIGLTYWPMMRIVILPQAVRRMIPAIVAQLATVTKDVSLGFVISFTEFVRKGQSFAQNEPRNNLQSYFMIGLVYFVLIWMLSRLARRLEVRQRKRYGAGKMVIGGGLEDLEALANEAEMDARVASLSLSRA
jgi:glutamate transport system permease protein